jgi:hypothetical protein
MKHGPNYNPDFYSLANISIISLISTRTCSQHGKDDTAPEEKEKVRMFPVNIDYVYRKKHEDCPSGIPWHVIKEYEEQAIKNHTQTLNGLAKRGGLSPTEIYAVMHNRKWQVMKEQDAIDYLRSLL